MTAEGGGGLCGGGEGGLEREGVGEAARRSDTEGGVEGGGGCEGVCCLGGGGGVFVGGWGGGGGGGAEAGAEGGLDILDLQVPFLKGSVREEAVAGQSLTWRNTHTHIARG